MEYKNIKFEQHDHIGILTFNRAEKLNAVSRDFRDELIEFFNKLQEELEIRVVVIRNEGRAFSAGLDLNDFAKHAESLSDGKLGKMQWGYEWGKKFQEIALSMRKAPQPLIAAISGPAVGVGFSICMACDVRIAGESAKFNAAFIRIGLSGGDVGSSYFLPRLIGLSRAAELLYTGRFLDAATAERIGFVSRMVPDDQVDTAALELANEMLLTSPFGLRMTKETLNQNLSAPSLESAIELENRTQILCMLTEDFKEGPRAFVEKRAPIFHDR